MHVDILAHQLPQTLFLFQNLVLETGKKQLREMQGFQYMLIDTHAMIAWRDYQIAVKNDDATLADLLDKEHTKQEQENRACIKTIGEVLLLTATQNIAQRGHDESEESNNKRNFREILNTVVNHDPLVKRRLINIHNAKYTTKIIQNEVLGCLAEMVWSEITEEVKYSEVFHGR